MWTQNGVPTASTGESSRSVGINVNGVFFGSPEQTYLSYLRPEPLDLATLQEVVILHELAHELVTVTGFLKDAPGVESRSLRVMVNTLAVLHNCVRN